MSKPIYEVVILDEVGEEVRSTFGTRDMFDWAISAFEENNVTVIRSGLVGENK